MDEAAFDMAACLQLVGQRDENAARLFMDQLYPLVLKLVRAHLRMKNNFDDTKLGQLFRAARGAYRAAPGPMPERLKIRILAQWRSMPDIDDSLVQIALLFRRALIGATLIMLACIVWSYEDQNADDDIAIINFEVRENILP